MSDALKRESPLIDHVGPPDGIARLDLADFQAVERPFQTQLNLRGDPADATFLHGVETALGIGLPIRPNTVAALGDRKVLWLGPDEWLILAPPDDEHALPARLRLALSGQHTAVTSVGHGNTVIRLTGAAVRDVLAMGCPLDLHPRSFGVGQCAQFHLAKALVTLMRIEDPAVFELIVRRSFADYLWKWIGAAAAGMYSHR